MRTNDRKQVSWRICFRLLGREQLCGFTGRCDRASQEASKDFERGVELVSSLLVPLRDSFHRSMERSMHEKTPK
jgi:hypothetical protein